MAVVLSGIISGSLEDCYDELGSRYQLPVYVLSAPTNLQLDSSDVDEPPEKLSPTSKKRKRGSELPIRLQLSTGPVLRLTVRTNDSVLLVRQHVAAMADVDVGRVRLFFAGKQLTDNTRLKDAGLRKNYTVQAVVSEAGLSETSLGSDAARVSAAELPSFAEEPSSVPQRTLPTSAVSEEQIGISVVAVPETGFVEKTEKVQMSAAFVPSMGSGLDTEPTVTSSAVIPTTEPAGDLSASSALPEDVDISSRGLDTSL